MSDLLEDFESFYISQNLATEGAIFRDTIADTPDIAIAIYEYPGNAGLSQVSGVTRSIQIVARDLNATPAKLKARALYAALDMEEGIISLTSERWGAVYLRQTPFKIKVDERNRIYYGFNLDITTYND